MTDLAATQRWMAHLIAEDAAPPALADPAAGAPAPAVEDVVRGSSQFSAGERLGLYGRAYRQRLVGCLREGYPGLCHALGDELFEAFALDYLRACPPRGYTLATLGAGWPAYLDTTRPDRDLPAQRRERWPDFLVDLARLERTFSEVYDGPGVEGRALPTAAELSARELDARWVTATITPVGCLRLVDARFPVGGYLVDVRRGQRPPMPAPLACAVAVSRRDYTVTITELDEAGRALLAELIAGSSVSAAVAASGLALPEAERRLGRWADRGLFAAIDPPRPERPAVQSTRGVLRC